MSFNSIEMIREVRADFEKLLELVTGPNARAATLDQMERSLFRHLLQLGRKLLQLFLTCRLQAESHAPQWGPQRSRLPYHSQKTVDYFSIFGKVEVSRAYFYSAGQPGKCPADRALSLPERCYSDFLLECAEVLGVESAYDKGLQVLARLLNIDLALRALEMSVAEQSQAVGVFYTRQAPPPRQAEGPLLIAQADGKGVPLVRRESGRLPARRGKGAKKTRKKEAIATALYTIAPYPRTPAEVIEALFPSESPTPPPARRPSPQHKRVFATLSGKPAALKRLAQWVAQRDGPQTRQRVALTDGARALQQQMQIWLPTFALVLDIIHAVEYLWKAGTALYGETDPQRDVWVKAQALALLSSHTAQVIERLEEKAQALAPSSQAAKTLRQVAQYFRRNLPYMDYARYLKNGWPIGTGVIEGTCRHLVKDRMELAGMRWTVAGAESLLALRAVNENGDWEEFHRFRRQQRHRRLYGRPLNETWIDPIERLEINQL